VKFEKNRTRAAIMQAPAVEKANMAGNKIAEISTRGKK